MVGVDQGLVIFELTGLARRAAATQIVGAGAHYAIDGGQATGDERAVFELANPHRQIEAFGQDVDLAVDQDRLDGELGIASLKAASGTAR